MRETVDGFIAVMSARSICKVEPGPVMRVTPRASSRRKMPKRSSPSRIGAGAVATGGGLIVAGAVARWPVVRWLEISSGGD